MVASENSFDHERETLEFHQVLSAVNALETFRDFLAHLYPGDSEIVNELIAIAREQLEQRKWWVTTSKIQSEIEWSNAAQVRIVREELSRIITELLEHSQDLPGAEDKVYRRAWWLVGRL